MNKKLMAVAVAGALAAPALAFAQASTVQIYGSINAEYGFAKGGAKGTSKTNNWDGLHSGTSNLGFKGEEKLSGGMTAFWQCESDLGFLKGDSNSGDAATQGSWCGRNSALGLKGGIGSFYVGSWDSPTKRAVGSARILGETGWHGVQGMLLSNASLFTGSFSARNSNSINYESPRFSGFQVLAQTTSTKEASNTTGTGLKGRSNSFSLNYAAGPLTAVVAHTALDDNRSASSTDGQTDTALVVGGTYTFGKTTIGLVYVDGAAGGGTTKVERKSYNIAGTYSLGGPGSLVAGYTRAGNTNRADDSQATGLGANSGAKQYTIGYRHALSKRTTSALTYMRAKNDSNQTGYSIGNNVNTGMSTGASTSVIAMQLSHKF